LREVDGAMLGSKPQTKELAMTVTGMHSPAPVELPKACAGSETVVRNS
jgi:hypothetical protein